MTQPLSMDEMSSVWTRDQLDMEQYTQMEWFVTLARTTNFEATAEWDRRKWREEFAAMYLRTTAVIPVPNDTKRFPTGAEAEAPLATYLPTIEQIQEVRDEIARHVNDLADGKGTSLGPFKISFTVSFHHVHDAYGRHKTPRHIIYRGETGEWVANPYRNSLLRHMTRLLETYCDQIRRCPHCSSVFLQNRRQQEYCGRGCQSVASMQKIRGKSNEKDMSGKKIRQRKVKASARRRIRHGKTKG